MDAWKSSSGWHQEAKGPQWAELKKTIKGYQTGFWIYVQERKFAKGLGTLVKVNVVVNTWQGKENDLYFYVAFWNFYTWIPLYSLHVSILQRPWEVGPAPTLKTLCPVCIPHLNSASFLGLLLRMRAWSGVCGVREPKPKTAGATKELSPVPCRSSDSASW